MKRVMKVSVIIPTYNRGQLVVEALESVLKQTCQDFEVIIVDDGSTDDTERLLSPFEDRIIYLRQENRGVNAARNKALKYANGEYIALLDSDDIWKMHKLDVEISILDKFPNAGFVYSDFSVLKPSGQLLENYIGNWYTYENDWEKLFDQFIPFLEVSAGKYADNPELVNARVYAGNIYHSSLFHPAVLPSASMYRREKSGNMLFNENDSSCGDWEFFARL